MPDGFDVRSAFHAAEVAAGKGDLATAEVCLREALRLQSVELGEDNPALAPTLNNLAVICERMGKLTDAEGFYRRAYAVAKAGHLESDPLVVTSHDNLQAFLEAYHLPALEAAPAAWVSIPAPTKAPPPMSTTTAPVARPATAPAVRAAGWLTALVLVAISVFLWWPRSDADATEAAASPAPSSATAEAAPAEPTPTSPPTPAAPEPSTSANPAPPAAATTATPTPPPPTSTPDERPVTPPASSMPEASATPPPPPARSSSGDAEGLTVVDARLCGELTTAGAWTCTAPPEPVNGGRLYFLTRVSAAATARVVHAWIRDERPVQTVTLTIRPSAGAGYRTYSRQTVDAARRGNWRVELRTPDGVVLASERFEVR